MNERVTRILAFGAPLALNLGGPSIFHGIVQVWRRVFPHCAITYLQPPAAPGTAGAKEPQWPGVEVLDMPRVSGRHWLACLARLNLRMGMKSLPASAAELVERIRHSDLVISAWGINYTSKLGKRSLRSVVSSDPLIRIAHRVRVGTVHYTASYGPMEDFPTRLAARWILGRSYDMVYCREIESERILREAGVKPRTLVCPDTGLLLNKDQVPPEFAAQISAPIVGISVSHQILRQWTASEPYLDLITQFCRLAAKNWQANILLIPNEINQPGEHNDMTVALRIEQMAHLGPQLRILPADRLAAGQQKAVIAACELLVASRYHSVVAALSSGVPTVVVGWHHKYEELLDHYGQKQWCLGLSVCSSTRLWQLAQSCWEKRLEIKGQIEGRHSDVVRKVYAGAEALRGVVPTRNNGQKKL